MNKLQKYTYQLQLIMLFLIPLWVAMGRSLFGAGGWLFFVTLFVLGPLLFVGLLIVYILSKWRTAVKEQKAFPPFDTLMLLIVYTGSIFFGFFIVDGGDTAESVGSAASKLFKAEPSVFLSDFAQLAMLIALASLGTLIVFSIYKRVKQ